ncbi:TetR/AcrR family transcriptional regulator [Clostridium bowmanii]|uniref:TetR/AcrR family transcriptional regulator n=1 Tax=Clostridium bowmanii TaxID=132925 RepID=UPI001C0BB9D4|nr:TetR/AcrR family transcriptional regulator [Clostridium bowmanii]MBU3190098.1 TetR/AcrR family transcriptional regulator [Clostridium bowmanii]MCA1074693.1 TetR/AcrR family transcriptional regulator [Clostridium bowmanii]
MNKTKKNIFQSAIKTFSTNGYDGATMDEISASAGVAKGTVYYYFKSKDEVFKYIITEGVSLLRQQMECINVGKGDYAYKLRELSKNQLRLVYDNRDLFKVIMSQAWGGKIRHSELRELLKSYMEDIEKFLIKAMEDGTIKKCDSSFLTYTYFGTLASVAVYNVIKNDSMKLDEITDNFMNHLLNGIR